MLAESLSLSAVPAMPSPRPWIASVIPPIPGSNRRRNASPKAPGPAKSPAPLTPPLVPSAIRCAVSAMVVNASLLAASFSGSTSRGSICHPFHDLLATLTGGLENAVHAEFARHDLRQVQALGQERPVG